jgi:hypothetical protein
MSKRLRLALTALLFCSFSAAVFGQASDGNLVGAVLDPSGAAIANATIEIENNATGVRTKTSADGTGRYRFNNVPVGRYKITVSAPGFTTTTLQNHFIELNVTSTANVTMAVGAVATTVEVIEATAAIDTTTARITTTFESRAAVELPSGGGPGGMGVLNLSLLSSGVSSMGGVGYGSGPSVGGQRPTNNNFMIEGVDNNFKSITGPVVRPSNEAISQFTLQQNQFSAEFGHSTGGQFNTVLKMGGNEYHGAVYEYFNNRNLNAVDEAFARQGIRSNPRFDQNRFGGSLGGPILRNKWFFFGNYEYMPIGAAATAGAARFAPTADGIRLLEGIPGLRRANLDFFKQWVPVPPSASGQTTVVSGVTIPLGIIRETAPAYENRHNWVVSSDYYLSERTNIRARYLNYKIDQIDATANLGAFFEPVPSRNHMASLSVFHSFSPSLTNELRLGYLRESNNFPVSDRPTLPGLDSFPNIGFTDLALTIGPNGNSPQSRVVNTIQAADNVNWIKGAHTLKFGYDIRKQNSVSFFVQRNRGDYQYNNLERYLLDLTPTFGQRSVGGFPFVGNMLSHYTYINDDWRIRHNVTLNLGLRYEFVEVPYGSKQQSLNAIASVPGVLEFREPKPTKKDFAPRLGVAWSPGRDGRTSVRAGFGMGYDQVYQNLGTNALPPQYFTTIDAHVELPPNQPGFLANGGILGTPRPITDPARARALTASYVPDQLRPYSIQWNFGVQRVMWSDYTFEARYLGSRGVHLPIQLQINRQPVVTESRSLPVFSQRPAQAELDRLTLTLAQLQAEALAGGSTLPAFFNGGLRNAITTFMPQGNSTYHGLALQATKRYSKDLLFTGAYTWSHNIDDSTAALFSTAITPRRPQDFQNLRPERSHSALDHRHRFTMAWVYDTPWMRTHSSWFVRNLVGNYTVSGTYTAESGTWATAQSQLDANINGDPAADRFWHNAGGDPRKGSETTALTNTAGATVAYLISDPTALYVRGRPGMYLNGGRNTWLLPGINNWNLSLMKKFSIDESKRVDFRAEMYNAFNHAQFTPGFPDAIDRRSRTAAVNYLIPGNASFQNAETAFQSNARSVQLTLRFEF